MRCFLYHFSVLFLFLLICLMVASCKSTEVTGGSASKHTDGVVIEFTAADGTTITVSDDRTATATTQPSVKVNGSDAAPHIGATTQPDDFGGISFDWPPAIKKTFADRYAWALAGVFLLCAAGCFWMHKYLFGVVCLCIGVLSALNPVALMIGAGVVLVGTLWLYSRSIKQLGKGIAAADKLTPFDVMGTMRQYTDSSVQSAAGIPNAPPASPSPAAAVTQPDASTATATTTVSTTIEPTPPDATMP